MTDAPVRLSCEQCKRRKTKCDKISPRCSACKLANISCHPVQRSRLPRGRTGNVKHKNTAHADKIARLEGLVGRLENQILEREKASPSNESAGTDLSSNDSRKTNRVEDLVARDFWTALSKEVVGLREILEGHDEEDNHQPDQAKPQLQSGVQSTTSHLLFNQSLEPTITSNTYVTRSMRASLVDVYRERVDTLFKVTHWPTVTNLLRHNDHNDITSKSNIASIALEWCMCFMAATTLSEQDCEDLYLGSKACLVSHCRVAAETSLSQSNFLTDPSFHSLQAFTIYLVGLRTSGQGALTWTFISLAIRLASALDLGLETNNALSALDVEQRRRLWFGIGLLDSQAAFGRGSTPILSYEELKFPPLDINDAEIGIRTVSVHAVTEMTFSCVTHQGLLCHRRLCDPSIQDPRLRADIAASFGATMVRAYAHLEFSEIPLERYITLVTKDISLNMHLILRRPPHRAIHSHLVSNQRDNSISTSPPFNILQAAMTILERGMMKQHIAEFTKWSWSVWPRWYALAILLVELGSTSPGSNANVSTEMNIKADTDKAYAVALQSFNNYAQSAAETSTGTIWPPIVKLMRHVRKLRGDTTPLETDKHPNLNATSSPTGTNVHSNQNQTQIGPNEHTILARYCDALSDYNNPATTATPSISETNPDLLWGAFLEDLRETTGKRPPTSAANINTPSFQYPNQTHRSSTTSGPEPATGSTWSLTPYAPMFPHLLRKGREQGHENEGEGTHEQNMQGAGSGQNLKNQSGTLTLMANGQEGRSVVGRVFDFM